MREAFEVARDLAKCGTMPHRITTISHLRIAIIADNRLYGSWRDVVGRGSLQGQVPEDSKVERLGDSFFVDRRNTCRTYALLAQPKPDSP